MKAATSKVRLSTQVAASQVREFEKQLTQIQTQAMFSKALEAQKKGKKEKKPTEATKVDKKAPRAIRKPLTRKEKRKEAKKAERKQNRQKALAERKAARLAA